jgi:hypothetical protein
MADMDIEMDIDVGFTEEDLIIPEVEIVPDVQSASLSPPPPGILLIASTVYSA